jgi:uncharacterized protein YbjT (DUF2867 family)
MSCITVFGGTGFLGGRVVRHLRESGAALRIASRHPGRTEGDGVERIAADAHDERAVEAAVAGADGVVNAVSLCVERGSETFRSVHVQAAGQVASAARRAGVKHLSGIGADAASPSPYIRSRGEGEAAVQAVFPGAAIIRPAVMFALDDGFLTTILGPLRLLPAYPMFGDGRTKLQPVYADDVAAAIAQVMRQNETPYHIYELAGPRVHSYAELLRTIAREAGLRPVRCGRPSPSGLRLRASPRSYRTRPSPAIKSNSCRSIPWPRTSRDFANSEFRRDRSKRNSRRCLTKAHDETQPPRARRSMDTKGVPLED